MLNRYPVAAAETQEYDFLQGGGKLGEIIAKFDWSATSLSSIERWPQSLKTAVGLILRSPVPIVTLWNEDGVMIYNDAYSVFAGGRHPVLLGSKVREGWPEVADFNDNVMKVGLAGGTLSYQDQELTLYRNGIAEQVWMNLDYSPILDETGVPAGVIAIVVETTAKVRAERRLSGEHERLRMMFEQAPGFMAILSGPEHVFTLANPAYSALVGQRDVIGKSVRDALPEVASQGFIDILDDVFSSGRAFSGIAMPALLQRKTVGPAERRHLDLVYQPVRSESGEVMGIFVQGTDVTDRVLAEDSLRASEVQFRALLEQQVADRTAERDRTWHLSSDIMLVSDFQANIVAVNPALASLLDLPAPEIIGVSYLDFVHADDLEASQAQLVHLRDGLQPPRFENRFRRKDGTYRILSWTAVPDAQFIYAVGRDVTADREAAEAMKRTELALQRAQKMETIGKLTGGVAHDFNNLLQVISGNLQLLAMDVAGSATGERRLASALAGVNRGAKLASYLLAFGRRQALEPKVVKIGRFVAGMEDMLRRTLGEEIEIDIAVLDGLWNTQVDTAQVENAVLNLSINARDAMKGAGKLTIEISNTCLDDTYASANTDVVPGDYVMLAITDTGSGMSPDVMEQAFEPFFSTKPEGKGTGLGLSMVYGFLKQSGGYVSIYSEVGHGTTVKLYFPRTYANEDAPTVRELAPAVGGSETILVVEDDEQVRDTVVEMLGELGYHVLQASNASSALDMLESDMHIDMLFTDVIMPGALRSPDLARMARERLPHITVLFTSGYAEKAIVHGGRLDAGVALLGKPYTREALASKIRQVLTNRQQPAMPPLTDRKTAEPSNRFAQEQPGSETPKRFSPHTDGKRILVIDDNQDAADSLSDALGLLGHDAKAVFDGMAGIRTASEFLPEVILLDIGMPILDGYEIARRIRTKPWGKKVLLIAVTGWGQDKDRALAKEAGFDLHLTKPIDFQQLGAILHSPQILSIGRIT